MSFLLWWRSHGRCARAMRDGGDGGVAAWCPKSVDPAFFIHRFRGIKRGIPGGVTELSADGRHVSTIEKTEMW